MFKEDVKTGRPDLYLEHTISSKRNKDGSIERVVNWPRIIEDMLKLELI